MHCHWIKLLFSVKFIQCLSGKQNLCTVPWKWQHSFSGQVTLCLFDGGGLEEEAVTLREVGFFLKMIEFSDVSAPNSGTEEWILTYFQILLKSFRSSLGMKTLSFISWVWNRNFCFERKALHARFLCEPWRLLAYLTLWNSVSVHCSSASNRCVSHRKALKRCFLTDV